VIAGKFFTMRVVRNSSVPRLIDGLEVRNGGTPVKRTTLSSRRSKRTILFGLLAAGSIAAFFLAPVPGDITAFHRTGPEGTAMTSGMGNGTAPRTAAVPPLDASLNGVTETATFALG